MDRHAPGRNNKCTWYLGRDPSPRSKKDKQEIGAPPQDSELVRSPALSSSPSSPDFLIGQNSRKKNLGGIRNVERGKSGMGTAETGFHHQTRADAGATANANDQKKCRPSENFEEKSR